MKYSRKINDIFKYRADRWKDYTPSVRPSPDEINQYKQMIVSAGRVKPKCLILGSTPELRDLLYTLGCTVTLIDINEYMIQCMGNLMQHRSQNEKIIVGNWLTHQFGVNKFDFVIGDHIINMIPTSDYNTLIRVATVQGFDRCRYSNHRLNYLCD